MELSNLEKFVIKGIMLGYTFSELAMIAGTTEHIIKQAYYEAWYDLDIMNTRIQPFATNTTKEKISTNNIENWGYVSKYRAPEKEGNYAEY